VIIENKNFMLKKYNQKSADKQEKEKISVSAGNAEAVVPFKEDRFQRHSNETV
jgi:hypothetical protein